MNKADHEGASKASAPSERSDPEPQPETPSSSPRGPSLRQPAVDIQAYIGSRLREVYDDVANQPVPDRFLELMKQLDQS